MRSPTNDSDLSLSSKTNDTALLDHILDAVDTFLVGATFCEQRVVDVEDCSDKRVARPRDSSFGHKVGCHSLC